MTSLNNKIKTNPITRDRLIKTIFLIFSENNILDENIKGSLIDTSFHFDQKAQTTFSDIDLMIKNCKNPKEKSDKISKDIYLNTNILIPVSIHSHNSLEELSLLESQDLALLECIYQMYTERFKNTLYRDYIRCKFALLISRIKVDETYKEIALRLNNQSATAWYNLKIGSVTRLDKKNNAWPTVNKVSLFWALFFQNKITSKQTMVFYNNTINSTTLSVDLRKRIKQKLNQVGFL